MDSTILMQRELSTFPLAPNYLHKLSSAGYITVDDLKDVSPTELSEGKFMDFFSLLLCLCSHVSLQNLAIKGNKKIDVLLICLKFQIPCSHLPKLKS